MGKKVYRSRISVLLIGFILAIFVPILILIFQKIIISALVIVCGSLFFILLIMFGIRYVISGNILYLKMWFIQTGSVKIDNIISVERSYNLLSAPAFSLKRLCINIDVPPMNIRNYQPIYIWNFMHKPEFWLISPVREQKFIEELININPNIYDYTIYDKKGIWRFWDWDI